jgi:hypothetical protein
MRLNCINILAVALTAAASTAHAQQAADPVMPRIGSLGAEAVFGGGIGANVLLLSSPNAAWLAGLSFSAIHQTDDISDLQGDDDRSGWIGFGDARLGRRWWRGERGERVRPLTGVGVLGGVSSNTGLRSWNIGGYGELGASYFVTPHVSLGAIGELAVAYTHESFSYVGGDRVTTRWVLRGNLVRVNASVYF